MVNCSGCYEELEGETWKVRNGVGGLVLEFCDHSCLVEYGHRQHEKKEGA